MISPYVKAAAERAGYRSPLEMPVSVPAINVCPSCGKHPNIDPEFYNQICIYCDFDECSEMGELQAMGNTLKEAADKWNMRCDAYAAGKGGFK